MSLSGIISIKSLIVSQLILSPPKDYYIALSKTPHIQYLCGFAKYYKSFYHSQSLWLSIDSNNQLHLV